MSEGITGYEIITAIRPLNVINPQLACRRVHSFAVDSREIKTEGAAFAAITLRKDVLRCDTIWYQLSEPSGEFYFDHHQYVSKAIEGGARLVICETVPSDLSPMVIYLVVPSVIQSLTELTKCVLDTRRARIVSVTGSSGKTTTVHAAYSVLSSNLENVGKVYTVRANPVSLSIRILDLFCSSLERDSTLVLEIPTDHHGCITALTSFTPPHVGIILNVRDAHVKLFGTREQIAAAKSEMVRAVRPGGTAILNYDDRLVRSMAALIRADQRVIGIGTESDSDLRASLVEQQPTGLVISVCWEGFSSVVRVPLIGRTSVYIALAALAAGLACGLTLEECCAGLGNFRAMPGRMSWLYLAGGRVIVFDNSAKSNSVNLDHLMESLLEAHWDGKRILALANCDSPEHAPISEQTWQYITRFFDEILLSCDEAHYYQEHILRNTSSLTPNVTLTESMAESARMIVELTEATDEKCYVVVTGFQTTGAPDIVKGVKAFYESN